MFVNSKSLVSCPTALRAPRIKSVALPNPLGTPLESFPPVNVTVSALLSGAYIREKLKSVSSFILTLAGVKYFRVFI